NTAVHSMHARTSLQFGAESVKLFRQNEPPKTDAGYYLTNNVVKKKNSGLIATELPLKIKGLRTVALRLTQGAMAKAVGVSQGAVAQWEGGTAFPEPKYLVKMAEMATDPADSQWFMRAAGIPEKAGPEERSSDLLEIPLFRDAAAAGTARVIDESEIESYISVPRQFMRGGKIVALKVKGDSMSPLILENHVVFVDVNDRDPRRLVEKMVAARDDGGVTIKWLRQDGAQFVLVPQHTAKRNRVRVFKAEDDVGIVGRVVKWIGEPPK
ncbi:MAG: putative prophage repressor, partial [Acidobacteriaceae bacterium]|nr:putative prophage repressor [Acidobacteriaceae bacterium]